MSSAAKPTRVVLSRELSAFLAELSIALHKYAIYPAGHPSLGPAVARVAERAAQLLEERPMLAFGVARQQLIIDGIATDPAQPVLRRLPEVLHQHHLGAMSVLPGIENREISEALHALAEEVGPGHPPLGLSVPGQMPEWPHLRLHPLTLERLELVDEEPPAGETADGQLDRRGGQLWIGLANAAMAMESTPPGDAPPPDPVAVARAIDDHTGVEAYDQVIVGYLLQIAEELKNASGAERALRRRTARLIGAMRPETLQRLVTMGGNVAQRRAFVMGATSGMAVDSVVKIVKAAADAGGQTISHGLVRMLSKLAAHAEAGGEHARGVADGALREQVDRLLSGWNLESPSPDGYAQTLQHLATGTGAESIVDTEGSTTDQEADPFRVVQISLEVGGAGPLVGRAIDRAIDAGHVPSLLALLTSLPPESSGAADLLRARLSGPRAMSAVLSRDPIDFETLDALLPAISIEAYAVLLDTLITSAARATRRKLLDRLAPTSFDAAPLIAARLDDERWYVQRNLLLLLERLGRVPSGFSAAPWAAHPDSRVRYQGVALQLTIPHERDAALHTALTDRDLRIVRLGLVACQDRCPSPIVPYVANLATSPAVADELRIHAVRALAASRDRQARDALLRLVHGGRTLLGRPKLAPRTTVVLGALRALAERWSSDMEAGRILALARQSSDPNLRRVVELIRV